MPYFRSGFSEWENIIKLPFSVIMSKGNLEVLKTKYLTVSLRGSYRNCRSDLENAIMVLAGVAESEVGFSGLKNMRKGWLRRRNRKGFRESGLGNTRTDGI